MEWQQLMPFAQILGTLASVLGTFSVLRARDNERAAKLTEIQADIRYLIRRVDRLEGILISKNESFDDGRASA